MKEPIEALFSVALDRRSLPRANFRSLPSPSPAYDDADNTYRLRLLEIEGRKVREKYTCMFLSYVTARRAIGSYHFQEFFRTLTRSATALLSAAPAPRRAHRDYHPIAFTGENFFSLSLFLSLPFSPSIYLRLHFSGPTDFNSALTEVGWAPLFAPLYVRRYVFVHIFPGLYLALFPPLPPFALIYRRSAASTYRRTALSPHRSTLCPSARFFLFFNIFFSSMP